MFKLFKRIKREHTINIVAEFNNDSSSLNEIAQLTNYISDISNSVQIVSDLQAHPSGYRISFKLTFFTSYKNKRTSNRYTHYVSRMYNWLSDNKCIQRYYYNYN